MTLTLPGADIRGYGAALGIDIPDWANGPNVTVRCFANPSAHRRDDRRPSCALNIIHGAWKCHGCGAEGGAYDIATARGYAPRAAIDLMVAYGLEEHHPYRRDRGRSEPLAHRLRPQRESQSGHPSKLAVTEPDIARWQTALANDTALIHRLARERGWLYGTMLELGLGADRERITIPVRDHENRLTGLLRYHPNPPTGKPKMLAVPGSRRALLPHPAAAPSSHVLLVEGEPDMIAARSRGLPAIAVPGADSWRASWAQLLRGRDVTIVMDCDPQGRTAATAIAADLQGIATTRLLDLAPDRNDGYDLTDWLHENARSEVLGR